MDVVDFMFINELPHIRMTLPVNTNFDRYDCISKKTIEIENNIII